MEFCYYINNSKLIKSWLKLQTRLNNHVTWSDLIHKFGNPKHRLILCSPNYYKYLIDNKAISNNYVHGKVIVCNERRFFRTFYRINLGIVVWENIEFVKEINTHLFIEANFVKTNEPELIDIELNIEYLTETAIAANC